MVTTINYMFGVNKIYEEKKTIHTMKHGGGSLLLGQMSYNGTENKVKIDCWVNAGSYQKILKKNLHSLARKLCIGNTWISQHDKDWKHKKLTLLWLHQKKGRFWSSHHSLATSISQSNFGDKKRHEVYAKKKKTQDFQDHWAFCQGQLAALPQQKIKGLAHNYEKDWIQKKAIPNIKSMHMMVFLFPVWLWFY